VTCAKAQIDIIPKDRRIAIALGHRAGHEMRMRVPFDDFATGIERGRVQGVRELAETAADRRDDAAFAQLAPFYVSGAAGGATDLSPKAERAAAGDDAPSSR